MAYTDSVPFARTRAGRACKAVLPVVLAIMLSRCARPQQSEPPCGVRYPITPPPNTTFAPRQLPALSRDGSRLAFTATALDGITRLWIYSLRRSTSVPLPGTEGATFPFWSPDGESLGFFAEGRLKRIGLLSDGPQVLGDASDGAGGSWSADGVVLFSATPAHVIFSVPASGGTPRQLTSADTRTDKGHRWPTFLSDGRHFLYASAGPDEYSSRVLLGSLRSSEQNSVLEGINSPVAYVPPGFLVYAARGVLFRKPFDPKTLESGLTPGVIVQAVARDPTSGLASFSASADGSVVAYARAGTEIVWLDGDGLETGRLPDPGAYRYASSSPSGKEILVSVETPWLATGGALIYVYETTTDRWRRVIDTPQTHARPLWSADGRDIILTEGDATTARISAVRADGSGASTTLFTGRGLRLSAAAVSPQGRLLAVIDDQNTPSRHTELRVVSLAGSGSLEERTVWHRQTTWNERAPAFSADGRMLAYISEQSGLPALYVTELTPQAVPSRVAELPVDTTVVWSADGQHLFYRNRAGVVTVSTHGPASEWGHSERLVYGHEILNAGPYLTDTFDVTRDGSRFLLLRSARPEVPAPLMVMVACQGSAGLTIFP